MAAFRAWSIQALLVDQVAHAGTRVRRYLFLGKDAQDELSAGNMAKETIQDAVEIVVLSPAIATGSPSHTSSLKKSWRNSRLCVCPSNGDEQVDYPRLLARTGASSLPSAHCLLPLRLT
jgi:hypothetical protein